MGLTRFKVIYLYCPF